MTKQIKKLPLLMIGITLGAFIACRPILPTAPDIHQSVDLPGVLPYEVNEPSDSTFDTENNIMRFEGGAVISLGSSGGDSICGDAGTSGGEGEGGTPTTHLWFVGMAIAADEEVAEITPSEYGIEANNVVYNWLNNSNVSSNKVIGGRLSLSYPMPFTLSYRDSRFMPPNGSDAVSFAGNQLVINYTQMLEGLNAGLPRGISFTDMMTWSKANPDLAVPGKQVNILIYLYKLTQSLEEITQSMQEAAESEDPISSTQMQQIIADTIDELSVDEVILLQTIPVVFG